jgi:hypothetical protein
MNKVPTIVDRLRTILSLKTQFVETLANSHIEGSDCDLKVLTAILSELRYRILALGTIVQIKVELLPLGEGWRIVAEALITDIGVKEADFRTAVGAFSFLLEEAQREVSLAGEQPGFVEGGVLLKGLSPNSILSTERVSAFFDKIFSI